MSEQARIILQKHWGYDTFRPLQEDIVDASLMGEDVFALLPTGGGKSICFQIPALCKEGIALVISPLVALMNDQVRNLESRGIPAMSIQAGMKQSDIIETLRKAASGDCKLLYISPERLQTKIFKEFLPELPINLLAVDEAHCISQWGYDFRPQYLEIRALRKILKDTPCMALTGSANPQVIQDIVGKLNFKTGYKIFRKSFVRENIHLHVRESNTKAEDICRVLKPHTSSIVYGSTRGMCEQMSEFFNFEKIESRYYHAGLEKQEREQRQNDWIAGKPALIVCTNAFGMGIDKPDVRYVFHADIPSSPEAYYQEAGRAGRDGNPSLAALYYNERDIDRMRMFILQKFPDQNELPILYEKICNYLQISIDNGFDEFYNFDFVQFSNNFNIHIQKAMLFVKLFAQQGFWVLSENTGGEKLLVKVLAHMSELQELDDKKFENLKRVFISIQRLYSHIRYQFVEVNFLDIAIESELNKTDVPFILEKLDTYGFVKLEKRNTAHNLNFLHNRKAVNELIFDAKIFEFLKRREIERMAQMVEYSRNKTICRHKLLVSYFGEELEQVCGKCDVCKNSGKHVFNINSLRTFVLSLNTPTLQQVKKQLSHWDRKELLKGLRMGINLKWWTITKDGKIKVHD